MINFMHPIAQRRQEEKQRRRDEILDAAESVVAATGWDAATMEEVARYARLSRALLYIYFRAKKDLLLGVAERALTVLSHRVNAAASRPARGLDQIHAIARAYFAFAHEFPVYFETISRLALLRASPGDEALASRQVCARLGGHVHQLLAAALSQGVRDGSIRPDLQNPQAVAALLEALMLGVTQTSFARGHSLARSGVDASGLLQEALEMAVRPLVRQELAT